MKKIFYPSLYHDLDDLPEPSEARFITMGFLQDGKLYKRLHGGVSEVIGNTYDLSVKADKIIPATVGNFAGLDATGNLIDSGSNAFNFQTALGFTPEDVSNKENTALDNSTTKYPTNNLVKTSIDNAVAGLLDDRGSYSPNTTVTTYPTGYPTTTSGSGGSGIASAIMKGDCWFFAVDGYVGTKKVNAGGTIRAIQDTPTNDAGWDILESNIGFVPENSANKNATNGYAGLTSGLLDGDQLPAMSTTKKGGVPATGTPSGKFLKDDNTWTDIPSPALSTLTDVTITTPLDTQVLTYNTATSKWINQEAGGTLTYIVKGGGNNKIRDKVIEVYGITAGLTPAVIVVEGGADYIENLGIPVYPNISLHAVGKPKVIKTTNTSGSGVTYVPACLFYDKDLGNNYLPPNNDFIVKGDFQYNCDYGIVKLFTVNLTKDYIHHYYSANCINASCIDMSIQGATVLGVFENKCQTTTVTTGVNSSAIACINKTTKGVMTIITGTYTGTVANAIYDCYAGVDASQATFNNLSTYGNRITENIGIVTGNFTTGALSVTTINFKSSVDYVGGLYSINAPITGENATYSADIVLGGLTTAITYDPSENTIINIGLLKGVVTLGSYTPTVNVNRRYSNNTTLGIRCRINVNEYYGANGSTGNVTVGQYSLLSINDVICQFDLSWSENIININSGLGFVLIKKARTSNATVHLNTNHLITLNGGNLILDNSILRQGAINTSGSTISSCIHATTNSTLSTYGTSSLYCNDLTYGKAILVDTGVTLQVQNFGNIFSNVGNSILGTYTELITNGGGGFYINPLMLTT